MVSNSLSIPQRMGEASTSDDTFRHAISADNATTRRASIDATPMAFTNTTPLNTATTLGGNNHAGRSNNNNYHLNSTTANTTSTVLPLNDNNTYVDEETLREGLSHLLFSTNNNYASSSFWKKNFRSCMQQNVTYQPGKTQQCNIHAPYIEYGLSRTQKYTCQSLLQLVGVGTTFTTRLRSNPRDTHIYTSLRQNAFPRIHWTNRTDWSLAKLLYGRSPMATDQWNRCNKSVWL